MGQARNDAVTSRGTDDGDSTVLVAEITQTLPQRISLAPEIARESLPEKPDSVDAINAEGVSRLYQDREGGQDGAGPRDSG